MYVYTTCLLFVYVIMLCMSICSIIMMIATAFLSDLPGDRVVAGSKLAKTSELCTTSVHKPMKYPMLI